MRSVRTATSTAGGQNANGQWGNGTVTQTRALTTPVRAQLPAGVTVTSIVTSGDTAAFVSSDGGLYMWGYNDHGQLGNGTRTIGATVPTAVAIPGGALVAQVSVGSQHVIALTTDGRVFAWGLNNLGQLGLGDTSD